MIESSVVSEFADLCGARDLDPNEVLRILNAQDWEAEEEMEPPMCGITFYEEPDEEDGYIGTAGLKIYEE